MQRESQTIHGFELPVPVPEYQQNSEQKTPNVYPNQSGTQQSLSDSGFQSDLDKTMEEIINEEKTSTMENGPISEFETGKVGFEIEETNLMNNLNGQFQSNIQSQNWQEFTEAYGDSLGYSEQTNPKVLPEIVNSYPANSQYEQIMQTSAYSEFQTNRPDRPDEGNDEMAAKAISEYVEPLPADTLYR